MTGGCPGGHIARIAKYRAKAIWGASYGASPVIEEADLDTRPYRDEHDMELLRRMLAAVEVVLNHVTQHCGAPHGRHTD